MRKQIFFGLLLITGATMNAQNIFPLPVGTRVGIGTTAPAASLHVKGINNTTNTFRVDNSDGANALLMDPAGRLTLQAISNSTTTPFFNVKDFWGVSMMSATLAAGSGGAGIGINTLTPGNKLEVKGKDAGTSGLRFTNLTSGTPTTTPSGGKVLSVNSSGDVILVVDGGGAAAVTNTLASATNTLTSTVSGAVATAPIINSVSNALSGTNLTTTVNGVSSTAIDLSSIIPAVTPTTNALTLTGNTLTSTVNGTVSTVTLPSGGSSNSYWSKTTDTPASTEAIYTNGTVNIGVQTLTNTENAKLNVNGKILAEEVKVIANIAAGGFTTTPKAWADKVFEKDYALMKLSDLEQFIAQNKHLPEIPSEKEVKEKGIEITDLNVKLLQKVEELTLYLLKQEKEIQLLKEKVAKVENK